MPICPKVENCDKIQMVLDKDLPFDRLYGEEMKKVCQFCSSHTKEEKLSTRNKKTVILTYS